jgi:hypothetical protein
MFVPYLAFRVVSAVEPLPAVTMPQANSGFLAPDGVSE